MTTPPDETDRVYTASDLNHVADLSYRQLNDWDSKGVLPRSRNTESGWRKFTAREVFVAMVCSEIRTQFNVPLESLRWLSAFMLQDKANHFIAAVEHIENLGMTVFILTDLKDTFIMGSDLEISETLRLAYCRNDNPATLILLKVNPLVNRLLGCLKTPIHLEAHGRGYELLQQARSAQAKLPQVAQEGESEDATGG